MVGARPESTASLPLVLLALAFGIFGVVTSSDTEKCDLTGDVLDCSNRGLESVPQIDNINASFPFKFNLSFNDITIESGEVFNFVSDSVPRLYVSELYLDHNKIKYMPPETLNPFLRTKIVDLSWNQMETISAELFSSLMEIQRISLAGNPISVLDMVLPDTVEELDVSSCRLSKLGPRMFAGLHLKSLDISNNSLTAVDWSQLDNKTSVRIDDNPWDCHLLRQDLASLQERCTTTTGSATTTTEAAAVSEEVDGEAATSATTEAARSVTTPEPPEDLLWSSFGIVEGVLLGWLVYLLVVGSAAWLRARALERDLARDGNWWLEPRL